MYPLSKTVRIVVKLKWSRGLKIRHVKVIYVVKDREEI